MGPACRSAAPATPACESCCDFWDRLPPAVSPHKGLLLRRFWAAPSSSLRSSALRPRSCNAPVLPSRFSRVATPDIVPQGASSARCPREQCRKRHAPPEAPSSPSPPRPEADQRTSDGPPRRDVRGTPLCLSELTAPWRFPHNGATGQSTGSPPRLRSPAREPAKHSLVQRGRSRLIPPRVTTLLMRRWDDRPTAAQKAISRF